MPLYRDKSHDKELQRELDDIKHDQVAEVRGYLFPHDIKTIQSPKQETVCLSFQFTVDVPKELYDFHLKNKSPIRELVKEEVPGILRREQDILKDRAKGKYQVGSANTRKIPKLKSLL